MYNRNQGWFDTIVRGLATQLWIRATLGDGRCTYRSPEGRKCGVGHIIPDNAPCIRTNYTAMFMRAGGRMNDLGLGTINKDEVYFLEAIQAAHDNHEHPTRVKEEFIKLGERFKLTWPSDIPQ